MLALRYGLDGSHSHTPAETSAKLGITTRQIRWLETSGLERLARNIGLREAVGYVPRQLRALFPFGLATPWNLLKTAASVGTPTKLATATVVVVIGGTTVSAWQGIGPFGRAPAEPPSGS